MEQTLLSEIQERINQIETLEGEKDDTKNQLAKKKQEIQKFHQEWKNNCPHAFYRIQQLVVYTTYTTGYYCCLCGTYQHAQYPKATSSVPSRYSRDYTHKRQRNASLSKSPIRPPQITPIAEINAPNFIGTVIESVYASRDSKEESPYPIPPKYQAKVSSKKEQLGKLETDEAILEEKLKSLEVSIDLLKTELNNIAHLLNGYFGYPEVVYRPIHRWTRDDFNYDPFE